MVLWQAKRQEAAAAANSPNRIKAAAELLPEEQPKLDAVDVEDQEELAHKFAAAIPAMPSSLARELSHMSLAAGIGNCSPPILQLDACNTLEVADSYQCYFVPVVTPCADLWANRSTCSGVPLQLCVVPRHRQQHCRLHSQRAPSTPHNAGERHQHRVRGGLPRRCLLLSSHQDCSFQYPVNQTLWS